ncbi:hypothetical protein [Natronoglycomyces albus]|uniref:Uncharacterized protein n=1 Tax=Natronoglycomyces albus TaxID=2811108 RepID=A0A895XLH4_9ACTN|nr:hypothetical protein [Natronoglycomyces albus]QSB04403.1 hypothetical protein JQS30_11435 [Natronoglycomyces albus]
MSQQLQSGRAVENASRGSEVSEPEPAPSRMANNDLAASKVTVPQSPASLWASTSRPISVKHSSGVATDPTGWIETSSIVTCE